MSLYVYVSIADVLVFILHCEVNRDRCIVSQHVFFCVCLEILLYLFFVVACHAAKDK